MKYLLSAYIVICIVNSQAQKIEPFNLEGAFMGYRIYQNNDRISPNHATTIMMLKDESYRDAKKAYNFRLWSAILGVLGGVILGREYFRQGIVPRNIGIGVASLGVAIALNGNYKFHLWDAAEKYNQSLKKEH